MNVSRRTFIQCTAGSAALALGSGAGSLAFSASASSPTYGPGNKWPGRVAINFNKSAVSGTTANETVIKEMVDDAIKVLTGEATVGAAWKAIFPASLSAQSKIAVKINILNNSLPRPSEFSVMAIIAGLQQMSFNGTLFPAANITIYDANNTNTMDSAGYTAARFPNISRIKDTFQSFGDGAGNLSYATTLNACNFLINVFSPRGVSGTNAEGFTLGFKSHYGTYINPGSYHNTASPAHLRDINCTGPVLNKTVLSICSGIFGMNEGTGPRGEAEDYSIYSKKIDPTSTATSPTTIIMSTDPVSAEMQAIKMMRMNKNPTVDYSTAALPSYLRASGGVSGALTPMYTIGVIDETKMDVRRIINDQVAAVPRPVYGRVDSPFLRIIPLHNQGFTFIEYSVGSRFSSAKTLLRIFDVKGSLVFETGLAGTGYLSSFSWNQRDGAGRKVRCGSYIAKITVADQVAVQRFILT